MHTTLKLICQIKERSTTLRPHAPWFSDGLRALTHEKHWWEWTWVKSGQEVHNQLYRESANNNNIIMQPSWNQRLCTTTVGYGPPVRNSYSSWLIACLRSRGLRIFLLTNLSLNLLTDLVRSSHIKSRHWGPILMWCHSVVFVTFSRAASSMDFICIWHSFIAGCQEIHHGCTFWILFIRSASGEFIERGYMFCCLQLPL